MKKLVIVLALLCVGCLKPVEVRGVVVSHVVTADKHGYRTFSTIIKTEDGYVEEKTGLEYYAEPIGKHLTITVLRVKK